MSDFMVVLRSLLFYTGYVPVTAVMSLLFVTLFPLMNDRGRYRFSAAWCDFVLLWLRLSCGVRYRVIGSENLPESASVIVANHQSSWETLFFYRQVYPVAPILKQELLKIPLWGLALRLLKPIAIDRSRPREAGRSLLTQGVARLQAGYWVMVFPEGTRSSAGTMKRFSRGAARLAQAAGRPLVPVAHDSGHCWPARQFRKYPGTITLEIGPAVDCTSRDPEALTREVEDWIRHRVAPEAR